MNENMTKAKVMLIDGVMMELEINNRTGMIKILIYNQYFLLDISGVDPLRLSALNQHGSALDALPQTPAAFNTTFVCFLFS